MLHNLVSLFVPLLIIMDPIGNLPLFLAMTQELTARQQTRVAAIACLTAGLILACFGLTGDGLLRFFGITLPAFQLAGGIIFFIYALQMLNLIPAGIKSSEAEEAESLHKTNVALVPLATPLLAGPGAITAVLVWQQDPRHQIPFGYLLLVIAAACLAVFMAFWAGRWLRLVLGLGGIGVITRLTGLLLAVLAMQFMVNGLLQILGKTGSGV
ncbi:MAG TPA: MarC family protein [Methylothermaceae bacterium]|nr:MarC family protein [Methylothermaceae bacterium]